MANHSSAHLVMAALDAAIHALLFKRRRRHESQSRPLGIKAGAAEEQTQQTLALLNLLALGNQDIEHAGQGLRALPLKHCDPSVRAIMA